MPVRFSNPAGVHTPASRYSHAALVEGTTRRLVISGQIGVTPDGEIPKSAEEQVDQALTNLGTVLRAHGMGVGDIVKLTVFLTRPDLVGAWRARRTAFLGEHAPASTLLIVAGLADPRCLVEVEAEAAR